MSENEFVDQIESKYGHMLSENYGGVCINKGWYKLLDCLFNCIDAYQKVNGQEPIKVVQIKEKFGGLRFYYKNSLDEFIRGMVYMAENMSHMTCEECGEPGSNTNIGGYICTLCETHESEKLEYVARLDDPEDDNDLPPLVLSLDDTKLV